MIIFIVVADCLAGLTRYNYDYPKSRVSSLFKKLKDKKEKRDHVAENDSRTDDYIFDHNVGPNGGVG